MKDLNLLFSLRLIFFKIALFTYEIIIYNQNSISQKAWDRQHQPRQRRLNKI